VCFKLLEHHRISLELEKTIGLEQTGFRQGRSTCDQVLPLTTFVEIGFPKDLKNKTVFIELMAPFETDWHAGLLLKLSKVMPRWMAETMEMLHRHRRFRVNMDIKCSCEEGNPNNFRKDCSSLQISASISFR
jgi:hypothetical protein